MNIINIVVIMLVVILLILLVLFLKYFVMLRCPSCFHKLITTLERRLFWNSILRACLEAYLSLCIMVLYELTRLDAYPLEGRINVLVTVVTTLFCFTFPFYSWHFLFRRLTKLRTPEMQQRYGALYQNVDT